MLDNALFLQAIAGADGIDDRQQAGCPFPHAVPDYPALAKQGVQGLKVGLLTEGFSCPMHDKRVSDAVEEAALGLTALGATVEHVSVPMHSQAHNLWAIIGRMSATVSWSGKACGRNQLYMNDLTSKLVPLSQEKFDQLFTSGVNTLINGTYAWKHMPPTLLGKSYNLVRKLRDEYNKALSKYDVLIMPTIPFLAPRLADPKASPAEMMLSATGLTTNTSPFNLVSGREAVQRVVEERVCTEWSEARSTNKVVASAPTPACERGRPGVGVPAGVSEWWCRGVLVRTPQSHGTRSDRGGQGEE